MGSLTDAAANQLRVLQGVCLECGSAADLESGLLAAVGWIREAVGDPAAAVRISVSEGANRLRTAISTGEWTVGSRRRSARRRDVFASGEAVVQTSAREATATLPLVSHGHPVGVVEVLARAEALTERYDTLAAVISQIAVVVNAARDRHELDRAVGRMRRIARVSQDLVRARTREFAVLAAVRLAALLSGGSAAGWVGGTASPLVLAGDAGLTGAGRRELRAHMAELPVDAVSDSSVAAAIHQFGLIAGANDVERISVPDAEILVAAALAPDDGMAVRSLLAAALRHLADVEEVRRAREGLDLGLAITAHEVRGPLLGVRAVVDSLLESSVRDRSDRALLERSRSSLEALTALMDHLLLWSIGGVHPPPGRHDVVRAIRRTLRASDGSIDASRILVHGPQRMFAHMEPNHFQVALRNLLRNALDYSPPGGHVTVTVAREGAWIVVGVSDQGLGLSALEREVVFHPLVRGTAGASVRTGMGLGLYITRRVVEAQGGRVSVAAEPRGATFRIHLRAEADDAGAVDGGGGIGDWGGADGTPT